MLETLHGPITQVNGDLNPITPDQEAPPPAPHLGLSALFASFARTQAGKSAPRSAAVGVRLSAYCSPLRRPRE